MLVILKTGTPFISIILNIVVTFQHKTLLNRSMFHIGKDFLQIMYRAVISWVAQMSLVMRRPVFRVSNQDAQADLHLCYSHMAKTGFLMTWLKHLYLIIVRFDSFHKKSTRWYGYNSKRRSYIIQTGRGHHSETGCVRDHYTRYYLEIFLFPSQNY